ncbi:MAG: hypothetical protein QOJ17_4787, partial [Rhodospirillaceae bacterium]|nr:hypothetical protein [Rhodospirillaceae bacterium]
VTFKQIVAAAGLTTEPGRRPARLHDYADFRVMPTSA